VKQCRNAAAVDWKYTSANNIFSSYPSGSHGDTLVFLLIQSSFLVKNLIIHPRLALKPSSPCSFVNPKAFNCRNRVPELPLLTHVFKKLFFYFQISRFLPMKSRPSSTTFQKLLFLLSSVSYTTFRNVVFSASSAISNFFCFSNYS
jgi:hypothetical protein